MGELKNCASCGKIFVQITRNICPDCVEKDEEEFNLVREHIKSYPDSTVEEITEATNVDEKKILRWMREGRLEYTGGIVSGLTCKRCGIGISIGEYCPNCIKNMIAQLNATTPESNKQDAVQRTAQPQSSRRERMFVADRLRKDN